MRIHTVHPSCDTYTVNVTHLLHLCAALQALHDVNTAVDHTDVQADRDLFIQRYSTGQVRPVDRLSTAEQVRRL